MVDGVERLLGSNAKVRHRARLRVDRQMFGEFRYDTSGSWYRGNAHVHTTFSDGGRTPEELAQMYARAEYDFLFRTDHWVASNVPEETGLDPLLWLDGIELDGSDQTGAYYHVVCLGRFTGLSHELGLVGAMKAAREQGGLLILAHPNWSGNSLDDALRHEFDAVEIYNHVCHWLNGKGEGLYHWDMMLEHRPNTLGLAADDAHVLPEHPGWNGGWIVVNAPRCTREMMIDAIKAGNFYSSCGPKFHSIDLAGPAESGGVSIHVRTSPVSHIRLVGQRWHGKRVGSFEGGLFTEVTFEIPRDWSTVRLEIEDPSGRRAWTNPLFRPSE